MWVVHAPGTAPLRPWQRNWHQIAGGFCLYALACGQLCAVLVNMLAPSDVSDAPAPSKQN